MMNNTTASELADYLALSIPLYGSISRSQAERDLYRHYGFLPQGTIQHAIIIATGRGQIALDHGGATLRRKK